MPNFVFAAPIAELARGEKSQTRPAYLMLREPKLLLRNNDEIQMIKSQKNQTKVNVQIDVGLKHLQQMSVQVQIDRLILKSS